MKNNFAFVNSIKKLIPSGTRIKLISMSDPYAVPNGTLGTVDFVDDAGQIHMKWDNGSTLALIYNVDKFEIIPNSCETKYAIKGLINNEICYFYKIEKKPMIDSMCELKIYSKSIKGATLYDSVEEAEEACHSIEDSSFKIYPVCPVCHKEYDGHPAISRSDNKTKICPACGANEALDAFNKYYNLTN